MQQIHILLSLSFGRHSAEATTIANMTKNLHELCMFLFRQLKPEYGQHLRDSGLLQHLMHHLFSLLPESPLSTMKERLTSHTALQKLTSVKNTFAEEPVLNIKGSKFVTVDVM